MYLLGSVPPISAFFVLAPYFGWDLFAMIEFVPEFVIWQAVDANVFLLLAIGSWSLVRAPVYLRRVIVIASVVFACALFVSLLANMNLAAYPEFPREAIYFGTLGKILFAVTYGGVAVVLVKKLWNYEVESNER